MNEQVIVKAHGGIPLLLEVEQIGHGIVYLTNEDTRAKGLFSIGYPLEDVYVYSVEAWQEITASLDWSNLTLWNNTHTQGH